MPKFRNTSGEDRFVVAIGREVEDDGVFEVSEEQAPGFECQPSNYKRLDEPKKASKE
jgi:hypothetical protein